MNKKITAVLAALFMTGIVSAQVQTTTPETPACPPNACAPAACTPQACAPNTACASTTACTTGTTCTEMPMKKCHRVLTKEERHRFCVAKSAAIAKNPALAEKCNKHALCEAIVKEDPSMIPILEKLKKHCAQMRQQCQQPAACK